MERGITPIAGLVLRQGLALVLFGWGYDIYFNGHIYAKWLGAFTTPTMAVELLLAILLVTGLATRPAAVGAGLVFAALGLLQGGHQPIGLPQNFGLIGAAAALWLIGPGDLALMPAKRPLSPGQAAWALQALRLGLALTFIVYGIQKFTHLLEYRVVVFEIPMLTPIITAIGAEPTVMVLGILELAIGIGVLLPRVTGWSAGGQALVLLAFVGQVGYPFSYPQDLGLLGAAVTLAFASVWSWQLARSSAPRSQRAGEVGPRSVPSATSPV